MKRSLDYSQILDKFQDRYKKQRRRLLIFTHLKSEPDYLYSYCIDDFLNHPTIIYFDLSKPFESHVAFRWKDLFCSIFNDKFCLLSNLFPEIWCLIGNYFKSKSWTRYSCLQSKSAKWKDYVKMQYVDVK